QGPCPRVSVEVERERPDLAVGGSRLDKAVEGPEADAATHVLQFVRISIEVAPHVVCADQEEDHSGVKTGEVAPDQNGVPKGGVPVQSRIVDPDLGERSA